MGDIIKELPPDLLHGLAYIALFILILVIAIILWALKRGREVTFWPPKIGPSDQSYASTVKRARVPVARQKELNTPDGLTEDSPISTHDVSRWLGRWNCQWTIGIGSDAFAPYVDDSITIEKISSENSIVHGVGYTAYGSGGTYQINGRIVGGRIGIFIYSSAESAYSGLDGIMLVRMSAVGEIRGWWLGRASDGREVEGRVYLERFIQGALFELKVYPYPPLSA
jgi:hypothetical protein